MTQLAVTPALFTMSRLEKLPLGFDTSNLLLQGETPTSPAATVIQMDTGADVTINVIQGSPSVAGNVITIEVLGSGMTAGKQYRFEVTFSVGSLKIWQMELFVVCPY